MTKILYAHLHIRFIINYLKIQMGISSFKIGRPFMTTNDMIKANFFNSI